MEGTNMPTGRFVKLTCDSDFDPSLVNMDSSTVALTSNEIRLFELPPPNPPNDSQAPITGRTLVVPITTDIDYEALSYVWGNCKDRTPITINGRSVTVSLNLEGILRRLRCCDKTRMLWIDQICINQDDKAEKSIQVSLMRMIYTRASSCLFWLGEIRSDILLSDAASALEFLQCYAGIEEKETSKDEILKANFGRLCTHGSMKALRSIGMVENEWWQRTWTLQEAVLARRAYLLWGPLRISWSTVAKVTQRFIARDVKLGLDLQTHADSVRLRYSMQLLTNPVIGIEFAKRPNPKSEGPIFIAYRWAYRETTNPRDKVYALLGILPKGKMSRSEGYDYRLPVARLYSMFTMDLIDYHKSLHPIALYHCKHAGHMTPGLPSWVFDIGFKVDFNVKIPPWDRGGDSDITGVGDAIARFLIASYKWYDASHGRGIDWNRLSYNELDSELTLTGDLIDEITIIGDPIVDFDSPHCVEVSWTRVREHCQLWYQIAERKYRQGDFADACRGRALWPEVFWRGLIGNLVGQVTYHTTKRKAGDLDLAKVKEFVLEGKSSQVCQRIFATVTYRVMFITKQGWLGFGPHTLARGDQVWILDGGNTPFILRPLHDDLAESRRASLVGPSFVGGMMYGQVRRDEPSSLVTLM